MLIPTEMNTINAFTDLTNEICHGIIIDKVFSSKRGLREAEFNLIEQLLEIYSAFYGKYNDAVFISKELRENEYNDVVVVRGLEQYFNCDADKTALRDNYTSNIQVFEKLVPVVLNIIQACRDKEAIQINSLIYSAFMLFYPIVEYSVDVNSENSQWYSEFNKWTAEKILTILGEPIPQMSFDDLAAAQTLNVTQEYRNNLKNAQRR